MLGAIQMNAVDGAGRGHGAGIEEMAAKIRGNSRKGVRKAR